MLEDTCKSTRVSKLQEQLPGNDEVTIRRHSNSIRSSTSKTQKHGDCDDDYDDEDYDGDDDCHDAHDHDHCDDDV